MTNYLFIGADISLKSNQICAMNFDEHVFFNCKFSNTPDGCEMIINKIRDIYQKYFFDKIIIVCESTGVYSFHFANYFSSNEYLNNFNTEVYCLNAHDSEKYRKSFNDIEKTDPSDAFVLADFARVGRTRKLSPFRGSQFIALQRLTRQRYHIKQDITREKLYIMNNLYLGFSGLVIADKKDKPFQNMFSSTSCAVIDYFDSPEQIADTPIEELIDFISKAGKNRFKNPNENAKLLQKAMRASYRLDKVSYDSLNVAIASSINIIKCLESQVKDIDEAILKTVKGLCPDAYNILLSIRGIGPVYAAGIIAEIGSIDFFNSDAGLAKYAGLCWNRSQSGNFEKEDTSFSRHSNKYLRYYLIEATQSCVNFGFPFIEEFYIKKFNEVTKHQHKRALALSARKLVRLIYGLLRKNQLYQVIN